MQTLQKKTKNLPTKFKQKKKQFFFKVYTYFLQNKKNFMCNVRRRILQTLLKWLIFLESLNAATNRRETFSKSWALLILGYCPISRKIKSHGIGKSYFCELDLFLYQIRYFSTKKSGITKFDFDEKIFNFNRELNSERIELSTEKN